MEELEEQAKQSEGSARSKDVVKRSRPSTIIRYERNGGHFQFYCENKVILRLHVLTNSIIRFRYSFDGDFLKDFSYAIDKKFKPESLQVFFDDEGDKYSIVTDKLRCEISKEGMLVSIFDSFGNAICEDNTGFYRREGILQGIMSVKVTKKAPKTKQFYGLGDKPCSFNLRGQALENWNTDAFGFGRETDPLYRSIPFYYALNEGKAYGIFLDNTYRTRFSFDRKDNGVSSFEAKGGEMNYYFIYGPELVDVAKKYTDLTGTPEMPPRWALGYHQCRWSYHPESRVYEIADHFRKHQIPCDAIYLDIDYMNEYRCFTWNKDRFPNPKEMIENLKEQGFKTVVMIDPGIKVDDEYWVYKEGIEKGVYCRRDDGRLMKGPVWPPECVFPDYTNPDVRKWWGDLYRGLMSVNGVDGVWNDMNEPAVFEVESKTFPLTVRHNYDGNNCSHKKAHNIYGMQMSRATYDGLKKINPEKRPFVITRATYSGGQRYASAWTGDNVASWEHLHIANVQAQRMNISGFSFIGSDIGGFAENPNGELITRWLQLGIFHPFYRMHSMGYNLDGGAPIDDEQVEANRKKGIILNQEPWEYDEPFTSLNRKAIELRYQLLPYLYTAFWRYTKSGEPILQPLVFADQEDENTFNREEEFLFGRQILVSPVSEEGATEKETYLTKGTWYNYWTDEVYEGGQTVTVDAPLAQIPMFIRAGAVIPFYPVIQHTGEQVDLITLHVYFKEGRAKSTFYEDKGEEFDHLRHNYRKAKFEVQGSLQGMGIIQIIEGKFKPTFEQYKIVFHGIPFEIKTCEVDGMTLNIAEDKSVLVSANFKKIILLGNR